MNVQLLRKVNALPLFRCAALAAMLAGAIAMPLFGVGCSSDDSAPGLVAHADANRNLLAGRPATLDGSRSWDSSGRTIEYHWSIVDRPPASRAELADETVARPGFTPDCPGTYVFELWVSAGSDISRPVQATLTVDYAPADFVYLDTRVVSGDQTSIGSYQISMGPSPSVSTGPTLYPAPPFTDYTGSPVGFQVMVINRSDGSIVSHTSYPLTSVTDADAMASALTGLGNDKSKLVIVSSLMSPSVAEIVSLCGAPPDQCKLLEQMENLGASSDFMSVGLAGAVPDSESYSLVGVNGIGAGNGYERWSGGASRRASSAGANISGKIVRDNLQKFGFTYDYIPFETRTSSNGIQIGEKTYPLPSPLPDDKSGGFHVLILNRNTLEQISHKLYLVNRSGTAQNDQIKAMGSDLYSIAKDFDKLVIVSNVGTLPTIRSFGSDGASVEQALDLLGGTPGVFPALTPGDTYGLLGIGPGSGYPNTHWRVPDPNYPIVSVEASSVKADGIEADIRGLLKRDRQGWFVPYLSDGGGGEKAGIDYSLLTIALQEPVAWRGPDTDAEKKVYADISQLLLTDLGLAHPDDIRLYYYSTAWTWSDRYTMLYNLTCKDLYGAQCEPDLQRAFDTMQSYLIEELLDRDDLETWFYNDLTQLLDGLSKTDAIDLGTAYSNALKASEVDDKTETVMKVLEIVADVCMVVARAAAVVVAPAPGDAKKKVGPTAGLLSSLATLAMDSISVASKTTDPPGEVKAAASELWKNMLETYIDTIASMNQAFLYITEDWGRLQTFHGIYLSLYDKTQYTTVLTAMEPGFTSYFYKVLLPVVYQNEPQPYVTVQVRTKSGWSCSTINECEWIWCDAMGIETSEAGHCVGYYPNPVYRPADGFHTIQNLTETMTRCSYKKPTPSFYSVWKKGKDGHDEDHYYSDAQIGLFQSLNDGGMGVSRLEFYTRWPWTYEPNKNWDKGCNCDVPSQLCPN